MSIHWITTGRKGRLGISSRPRGGDWLDDDVLAWRADGVDLVVSLLTSGEEAELNLDEERSCCRSRGILFRSLPIQDRGVPASRDAFLDLVAELSHAIGHGRTVVVHCRQGIGRSAVVAAATMMALGSEPGRAIAAVAEARGLTVPDTEDQRSWIESLGSRMPNRR